MTCSYCGSRNSDTDHRCRRCGRRPGDTLNGQLPLHHTDGALAVARPSGMGPIVVATPAPSQARNPVRHAATPDMGRARQESLFPERSGDNVIPIEKFAPQAPRPVHPPKTAAPPRAAGGGTPKTAPRRAPRVSEGQGQLEFLPVAPPAARTLGTTVEAKIYCDSPVATTLHRAVAAALDWIMVLIAYGLFLLVFHLFGGGFAFTKTTLPLFGAAFVVLGFTYGIYWTVAGTETAGMRWTQLQLITFEGFPPETRHRVVRFAGACLSLCTVLGLLWSAADEEGLGWQDHISSTFPTPYDLESRIFQRR